ncbi:carbohydrate ABC transporter permease [Serinibacter arcticus]|uniref:N-Acetyl-D-glucosamine ABC transport system, permease protein 1 n=1 Tax=Serinibacter arcticus TaxID=1655435 RepID=A0A4Z1E3B2_9MICO|nr:sugar ABC transporter permease [Serinibacter arcticus]TGO04943.1 N-Acetyl-D-glucosamine ABC transport system, permease protein 1 [Serinibacter arcticus]
MALTSADDIVVATHGRGADQAPRPGGPRRRSNRLHGREPVLAWVFVAPMVAVALLFLIVPILMALWVSVSDWSGRGSPLASSVQFVGFENYAAFFSPGLAQRDLTTSIRNTFYFVLLVVPLQTLLALGLALVLNSRRLKAKSFFRTAYYFPSVTSSVAIAVVFLFMFSASGPVNSILGLVGIEGPNWFADPRGLIHVVAGAFGVEQQPAWASGSIAGISLWQWLAGPSVAMVSIIALVVWVSAGGYMLIFLSSLQGIDEEVNEAAVVDGASTWQRIRHITVPILRPTTTLVVTLGLIGTWQVFDQVYIMSQGNPGKTTLTPAYLSYTTSFGSAQWGQGTAISFMLFALIVVLTIIQRAATRDRENPSGRRRRARKEVAS